MLSLLSFHPAQAEQGQVNECNKVCAAAGTLLLSPHSPHPVGDHDDKFGLAGRGRRQDATTCAIVALLCKQTTAAAAVATRASMCRRVACVRMPACCVVCMHVLASCVILLPPEFNSLMPASMLVNWIEPKHGTGPPEPKPVPVELLHVLAGTGLPQLPDTGGGHCKPAIAVLTVATLAVIRGINTPPDAPNHAPPNSAWPPAYMA